MRVINFLREYRYYRSPCLEFFNKDILFYKVSFALNFNLNFTYLFYKLNEYTRDPLIIDFLYSYFKKIKLLENLFKHSGSLVGFYFFKKQKKIFRKSNYKLDFINKYKFFNEENNSSIYKRLDQSCFLSDFFLVMLALISLFISIKSNLAFSISIKRFNSVIVIQISKDFLNMFLILSELNDTSPYSYEKYSIIRVSFISEQESIIMYSSLKSCIKNIKNGGKEDIF